MPSIQNLSFKICQRDPQFQGRCDPIPRNNTILQRRHPKRPGTRYFASSISTILNTLQRCSSHRTTPQPTDVNHVKTTLHKVNKHNSRHEAPSIHQIRPKSTRASPMKILFIIFPEPRSSTSAFAAAKQPPSHRPMPTPERRAPDFTMPAVCSF